MDRHLGWDGCFNVRDLGGLPTVDGREIRWGAVVRSDAPEKLTGQGWTALREHGVRTVIDLRNSDERADVAHFDGVDLVHLPMDPVQDTEFWGEWGALCGTALYFRPYLQRQAYRMAGILRTVAHARPGGVLVHCVGGRDRTGLVVVALLALAGVPGNLIADDYTASFDRLRPLQALWGVPDLESMVEALHTERGTTAWDQVVELVESLDVESCLLQAGLSADDLEVLRSRLVAG